MESHAAYAAARAHSSAGAIRESAASSTAPGADENARPTSSRMQASAVSVASAMPSPLCERRCGRRERARNVGVSRIVHMREARHQGQGGRHARPALVAPGLLRPEVAARAGGLPVVKLMRADACAARPVEPVALGSELHVPEMGKPSPVLACALKGAHNRPAPPSLSAISRCRYRNPPHSATVGMPDSTARRTASRIGAFSESCRAWSSG